MALAHNKLLGIAVTGQNSSKQSSIVCIKLPPRFRLSYLSVLSSSCKHTALNVCGVEARIQEACLNASFIQLCYRIQGPCYTVQSGMLAKQLSTLLISQVALCDKDTTGLVQQSQRLHLCMQAKVLHLISANSHSLERGCLLLHCITITSIAMSSAHSFCHASHMVKST